MATWTRRILLGTALAGVGGVGLSAWVCGRRDMAWAPERLDIARAKIPRAEVVGQALRAQTSGAALAGALGAKPGLVAAMATECPQSRASIIAAQIREDYREGDVLVVRRWVLSRSEALIAAVT